jgi:hypothetical protein
MKQRLRAVFLKMISLVSPEIRDWKTGRVLGRGFIFSFGARIFLIGYSGRPLIPKFLTQERLTIWKQEIGFTTHAPPDFARLSGVPAPDGGGRVMNLLVTHLGGEELCRLTDQWSRICDPRDLWVAFGGERKEFEALEWPRKVFIEDPELRRKDNQREKQSYLGIFKAMKESVERENPAFIYLCEYDHIPLVDDLNVRQVAEMRREGADVMGHWLDRMDGSGHYFLLYHDHDPEFAPFWRSLSLREDKGVVLNMFGSGSLWSRQAFLSVAATEKPVPCYLEVHLPTLAHHLGFRVRQWEDCNHLVSNLPLSKASLEAARARGCWTVHPVK